MSTKRLRTRNRYSIFVSFLWKELHTTNMKRSHTLKSQVSQHTAFAAQQNGECMQPSPGTAAAFSRGTSYGLNGLAESSQPRERGW